MLNFWKKEKAKSPQTSPSKIFNGNVHSSNPTILDESNSGVNERSCGERCVSKSRLALDLKDVLDNKLALSYFSQYTESRGFTNVLCLWLDLEQGAFPMKSLSIRRSVAPKYFQLRKLESSSEKHKLNDKELMSIIMEQYMNESSSLKVRLPDEVISELKNCPTPETYLSTLKEHTFNYLNKEIWNEFLQSDWHSKYIIEIMTSGSMALSDILYSDLCLSNFIEFLEQEGLIFLIEFWLAATSFEKQFSSGEPCDISQIQNDAIIIYEKYVSMESRSRIGLNDRVRIAIEEGICTETKEALGGCFAPGVSAVEKALGEAVLTQYLSSQHYLSLLSETVMGAPRGASSVKSSSPPASTSSHDTASTEQQLWRRNTRHPCGLSFGRIDQLGRYVAEFEPEPDKKVSNIGRILKIFSNKDEDRVHEEMAWRVAEMIVKDITNITLGHDKHQHQGP